MRRQLVLLGCIAAVLVFAATAAASNWQYIDTKGASPGVFNRSDTAYTNGFHWVRTAGGAYTWWVFTGGGTLKAGPVPSNDNNDSWTNPNGYNNIYWKFRNDGSSTIVFDIYKGIP